MIAVWLYDNMYRGGGVVTFIKLDYYADNMKRQKKNYTILKKLAQNT